MTRKAINIPLAAAGILKFVIEIKKPTTTYMERAERLASQVSFCQIMGMTSITPAIPPKNKPIISFFLIVN